MITASIQFVQGGPEKVSQLSIYK